MADNNTIPENIIPENVISETEITENEILDNVITEDVITEKEVKENKIIDKVIFDVPNLIIDAKTSISETGSSIWSGVTTAGSAISNTASNVSTTVGAAIGTGVSNAWIDIKDTASNVASGASNFASNTKTGMLNYFNNIKESASNLGNSVSNLGSTAVNAVGNYANRDKVQSSAEVSGQKSVSYYLPSIGARISSGGYKDKEQPFQPSPIISKYSPRLFGSPPQLTSLNDIRLASAPLDKEKDGPVGDFYLNKILMDAQVANFVVGRALFTGGMASAFGIIAMILKYATALKRYDIFGSGNGIGGRSITEAQDLYDEDMLKKKYESALSLDDGNLNITTDILNDDDDETAMFDVTTNPEVEALINDLGAVVGDPIAARNSNAGGNKVIAGFAGITGALLTSLSVQQPFYTFETDWHSYIECVKTMINTAVIQLGLQEACIRIGDDLIPLGMGFHHRGKDEPWALYSSWITNDGTNANLGSITGIDTFLGDTSQYVSFMIDPAGSTESFTNSVGDSQIYSQVINQGSQIGAEIAFLTNSSKTSVDDTLINIAGSAVSAAEKVLTAMTAGVGRFTAAVAGSFAKSFVGNHTIYPQIFQEHSSTQTREITIHLNASGGDPYSYLMDILVPYFFILGMALPQLSKNNASAYTFPPLVQCNIPGVWGTRLGMVTSVSVNKNSSGKDLSINGYPLSIDVIMTVTDLQHVLLTSPQDRVSTFLNNHTMFDYIAVCAGVDKYRPNGAIRLVSRLALAANDISNIGAIFGNAILSDFTSFINRTTGYF